MIEKAKERRDENKGERRRREEKGEERKGEGEWKKGEEKSCQLNTLVRD